MRYIIICLLIVFSASCSLLDDFFRTTQTQYTNKSEKAYAEISVPKTSEPMLIVCQNQKDFL